MKNILLLLLTLLFCVFTFAQQVPGQDQSVSKDYLTKSRKQKSAAWSLLGLGGVLIGTGLLIGGKKSASLDDAATGGIIASVGIVSSLVSIPLFISSGKNRKKALKTSAYLGAQQPMIGTVHSLRRPSPTLSISIHF